MNAIIAESQKLRSEYEKIVQMNYPSFKTIDPVCRLSTESVATDIKLVADFFHGLEQSNRLSTDRPTARSACGRTIKELNLQPWQMALISSGP